MLYGKEPSQSKTDLGEASQREAWQKQVEMKSEEQGVARKGARKAKRRDTQKNEAVRRRQWWRSLINRSNTTALSVLKISLPRYISEGINQTTRQAVPAHGCSCSSYQKNKRSSMVPQSRNYRPQSQNGLSHSLLGSTCNQSPRVDKDDAQILRFRLPKRTATTKPFKPKDKGSSAP